MAGEVKILIEAANNASRALDQVDKDIQDIDKTSKNLETTTTQSGKAVIGSWTEISSIIGIAKQAYQTLQGVYKGLITDTVDYGLEVKDLSTYLGTSAEETSTLIQMADDLRIPISQLRIGMKKATQEGILPNIAGIKQMAQEYQALPNQLAKSQYATDKFGRAGQDMIRILELSAEEIDAMAQSAEDAGLVIDEKAVAASERYYEATDQLNDMITGLKITLGNELIPAITEVIETGGDAISVFQDLMQTTKDLTAANEGAAIAGIELNNVILNSFPPISQLMRGYNALRDGLEQYHNMEDKTAAATSYLTDETAKQEMAIKMAGVEIKIETSNLERNVDALEKNKYHALLAAEAQNQLDSRFEQVNESLKQYSIQLAFNKAAQDLTAEAAFALAEQLGLVDQKTVVLLEELPKLKEKWDANEDGLISSSEAAAGYNDQVLFLIENLADIPKEIRTDWYFDIHGKPPGFGGRFDVQHGMDMVVPPGYPNDSFKLNLNASSGERIIVIPQNQTDKITNNNRQSINIYGGLNLTNINNSQSLLAEFAKLMP